MKKLRMKTLFIALTVCSISILQAQENRSLSLKEAIELGLENSKQLKISLSKSIQAKLETEGKKDGYIPDLDVSGQYLRMNEPTVDVNSALLGESSDSEDGLSIAPEYLALGMASAKMPLFSGLKIRNGVRSAKYLENAANLDVEAQKSEVILNLVNAYMNLYKAQETVKLVEEDLAESKKRVKDFTRMNDNGVLALNDLLKAQLQESNTSLALLDAENNHRVANYNMTLLLGLDEASQLLLDSIKTTQFEEVLNVGDLRNKALSDRKDLQAMSERKKASETGVKIAKGDYWPSVGLSGGYAAMDIDQLATISNAWNVGLGVSFNISQLYKNGSHVHRAKEQLVQTQLMEEQLTDQVKREVFKSLSDYRESLLRMDVYKTAEKQAKENYRITKNKHDNNLATTTDLLDADVDLLQAELNLRFSKADALSAYCKLLEVSGQLEESTIQSLTM